MDQRIVRVLSFCSILIALSIVLTRFASFRIPFFGVENIRVGLGPLPIILGGIVFGPLFGALIGVLADIIGFMISPIGAYMPYFTLISSLNGIIPGLLMMGSFRTSLSTSFQLRFITGVILSQLLNQWLLLPWFLHLAFDIPVKASLIPRLFSAPLQIIGYIIIGLSILSHPLLKTYFFTIKTHPNSN